MKRKLILAILIGVVAMSVIGCGESKKPGSSVQESSIKESPVEEIESTEAGSESSSEPGSTPEGSEEGTEIVVNPADENVPIETSLIRHAREVFESATQRYALSVHLEQDRSYHSVYTDESGQESVEQYEFQSELDFEVDHDYQCTGVTIHGTSAGEKVDTAAYIEDTDIAYTIFTNALDEEGHKTGWSAYSNPAGSMVQIEAPDWDALAKSASAEKTEDGRYRLKVSVPLSTASQIAAYYCKYGIYQEDISEPVTVVFMFAEDKSFESCSVYNENAIEMPGGVVRKYNFVIKIGNGGLLESGAVPMEVKKDAYGLE